MKYSALIVEDEKLSRDFLNNLVRDFCPQLEVTGTAGSVEEAVEFINQHHPRIVFMDIEMQTGTAFDVLQQVSDHHFHVIFTTAFDHYAIQAIKFSAVDYLLKPINLEELEQAVAKAVKQLGSQGEDQRLEVLLRNFKKSSDEDYSISLSTSDGVHYVSLSTIIRLEAKGPYTTFFLKNGSPIMVSKNLKEYEMILGGHGFFRIHNSYIINLKEVKRWIKTDGGYAVMSDDAMVAISPKKKDEFMLLMSHRTV
ncbi:LytR/AlgR family response regulator transcription factor [Chitinophaga cymbidii]|uniref:DNA-binding response regulator n=1 Tax=Chitinophaga cymbidii TaxID=1096750 RepID=A0A512RQL8_9BACT|nr:response regulator transcription factor [Chitinophaga cymbidii]GEP97998.1 DNA-binding response regulator [Chitinophaga cymbidii]